MLDPGAAMADGTTMAVAAAAAPRPAGVSLWIMFTSCRQVTDSG